MKRVQKVTVVIKATGEVKVMTVKFKKKRKVK